LGVAYKQDIDDYRESPALRVIDVLKREGAEVTYFDPWVKCFKHGNLTMQSIPELSKEALQEADLVMITTAHTSVDYAFVQANAKAIFDTKNAMKAIMPRENIEVL
ncbi:MAG: UDP binding domain-containing protein, partial [Ruthenibacterium sp.]